ncbi:MAG: GspH/FimT family protein [Desulfobacterales bacterium]|nr:MAG: GspH/FimT family protein [Desulfobacterales bacterium]
MRNNSGFSAFEVAVALAIMAIIAAFVMPNYVTWLRAYRLRGATNNLVADMEMAKIRAIRENAFVAVQFTTDKYTIFIDNGAGIGVAGDWICTGDEILLRDRDLPTGVSFDLGGLTLVNNRTRFNGRGIPPDIIGKRYIPLMNAYDRKEISINRLGFMDVE